MQTEWIPLNIANFGSEIVVKGQRDIEWRKEK